MVCLLAATVLAGSTFASAAPGVRRRRRRSPGPAFGQRIARSTRGHESHVAIPCPDLSDGAATSMRDGAAAAYVVQWAWLAAGVPSMIMPRWAGDPAASEALLAEFHRRL